MTEEHRDRTLDLFIAAWAAPPPGPEFHSRVRRAFDREFAKVPWWRRGNDASAWRIGTALCGGAAVGGFLLVAIGLAFPQTAPFPLPWLRPSGTVDFEEIFYAADATPALEKYVRTVPMDGGNDMVLWKYFPQRPYDNILEGIRTQGGYFLYRITLPFFEKTERISVRSDPRAAYVRTGCVRGDKTISGEETVLGQEILLGYSTTVVQWNIPQRHARATVWAAPGLGCRELKIKYEGQRPDGTYVLFYEKRVLAVIP